MSRELTRDEVFNYLADKGAGAVVVHFSGGNDEGGVSSIEVGMQPDREPIEIEEPDYMATHEPDPDNYGWRLKENLSVEQRLHDAIVAPVYNEYSSFAGDFYVDGTVTWDVGNRKVSMDYNEELPQTTHHSIEV